jgi:ketosteroid isomerase-like protein
LLTTTINRSDRSTRTSKTQPTRWSTPGTSAGERVWVKVTDKNQRSANPKLAPTWERGTIVKRGVTGTSYRVDRPGRKRKKVVTVNVQQLKPYMEE